MAYGDASPYPALPNLPPNPDMTQRVAQGEAAVVPDDVKVPPEYIKAVSPSVPASPPQPTPIQAAPTQPEPPANPWEGKASFEPAQANPANPWEGVASFEPPNPAEKYRAEHPILQTVGRAGRDLAIGAGGIADVGLLPLKEVALGAGIATGNKTLQRVGMTPSMASTVESGIDQATGNVLKPIDGLDKATDFAAQMMTPGGMAKKAATEIAGEAASKAPGIIDAAKTALNPMGAAGDAVQAKLPVPNRVGPAPAPSQLTPDQQRAQSSAIYKAISKAGGKIAPSEMDNWLSNLADEMGQPNEHGAGIASLGPKSVAQALLQKLTAASTDTNPNIYRDSPITPESAMRMDQEMSALITPSMHYPNGKMTADGQQILAIKNSFLDMVENAMNDPAKVQGGAQGFKAIQSAKDLWSQAIGAQQIQQIIDRGTNAVGSPATSIANGFNTLLNNPNRMRAFKNQPEVVAAIKYAAKTGVVTGLLKNMGSKLNAVGLGLIGAGIGHHFGGVPGEIMGELAGNAGGYALGAPFRGMATKLQTNRGNAVIDAIRSKNLPPDIGTAATAVTPTVGANVVARGQQTNPIESQAHAMARDAIAQGAPRDAVIQRLQEHGFDPAGL